MLRYNTNEKYYEYISDNNIIYSLYEGVSMPQLIDLNERKTSDIVFIVLDEYADINIHFVDFVFGATFLGKDKDLEDAIKFYVDRFEVENEELIKLINDNLQIKDM